MSYKVIDMSYPEFEARIIAGFDISCESELPCPRCGGTMFLMDPGFEEQYMFDGTMERSERYYCDDCCTFADVTQVYRPTERRVSVKQDVFD
jgi:hypothetical protein